MSTRNKKSTVCEGNILDEVGTKKVTESIIEQLEDRILGGDLSVGDKLPSEKELSLQASVGRRAVREALKALEMKGLIATRRGSGSFVVRNDFDSYIGTLKRNMQAYLHVNRASLTHLLQFRELIGGSVISLLAIRHDKTRVSAIEEALEKQERALARGSASLYTKAHIDYHLAIINSIDNPIVSMTYSQIIELLEPYMKRSGSDPEIMRQSIREHREIVEAIKSGDTNRAQKAVHTHLESSLKHLSELVS